MSQPGDDQDQSEVIAFLSRAASYGAGVASVERCETHGSLVFLAGDRAYKLKRAVSFPYMDYSTVERRREMCRRELAINRRTAPMLYLGVLPILEDRDGTLRFGTEDEHGRARDWVVVMRRFDQSALLESLRQRGGLSLPLMRDLAEMIAAFHGSAEIVANYGGASGIRAVVEENAAILKAKGGAPFPLELVRRHEAGSLAFLARVAPLLERRQKTGRVRRCHGDLHLNNVCLIGGRPVLFDAIEFNDSFACIDVLYDLAFLLMDLDRHGLREHANAVLNRYLEIMGEHEGLAALPLFLSCRAAVRAHTTAAAADAATVPREAEAKRKEAVGLLERAAAFLDAPPPRLIAIGGVSGTGKTTLARKLAPLLGPAPGAVILRSDVIRKQLMGVPEEVSLPESAYAPAVTEEVYRRIAELAAVTLKAGYAVIADAVYGLLSEREAIAAAAEGVGVRFDGLWLEAPASTLEARIAARHGDASDATVAVLRRQLSVIKAPEAWRRVDAARSPAETLAAARLALGC